MASQSFFVVGNREAGIEAALAFLSRERGLMGAGNPDLIVERHALFSVEDARRLEGKASLAPFGNKGKAIVVAADRLFHEAQNALLKTLEEPPEGTTIILVVPAVGTLLPTVRSRTVPLPGASMRAAAVSDDARAFWEGGHDARGAMVEGILKRAKADDEEGKSAARAEARMLAEGLAVLAHEAWRHRGEQAGFLFLEDLNRLIPSLHDRSAPLKPILEHLFITAPKP